MKKMLNLKEIRSLIPQFIDNRFIYHLGKNSLFIMEKNGNAVCRMYWFRDDRESIYLDMLDVSSKIRRHGMGTDLQRIREDIGIAIGAKTAYLFVRKNSWMRYWYRRRGYRYYTDHEDEKNYIWMKKNLI